MSSGSLTEQDLRIVKNNIIILREPILLAKEDTKYKVKNIYNEDEYREEKVKRNVKKIKWNKNDLQRNTLRGHLLRYSDGRIILRITFSNFSK